MAIPSLVVTPKTAVAAASFLAILLLEGWRPLFPLKKDRWHHLARNATITVIASVVVYLLFSSVKLLVEAQVRANGWGLLGMIPLTGLLRTTVVVVLFDAWMYLWHRMNHRIRILWRFHRIHHTDDAMDVSTAWRFHPGELVLSAAAGLFIIALFGLTLQDLLVYETLMLPVIYLHHSDFYLPGRVDRLLRTVLVTPWMHWVHHSNKGRELNSNYGSILSVWDRIGGSFRLRDDPDAIVYGVKGFEDEGWQTVVGMLRTPLA
ncbi:MAG: sterol desaturase family protein [Candidatus Undinarchaeales archaeon]|jgi:sterol desaturase/sphingolipid hydroxylase (fatty acid hydroxylase superfamily)|nr:sterol desaturase family protein [Candidatus Undinarchaeales archaeon]MDP7491329.1 sterol desaturase family protein [Candidatus Undinarchaeales archaeon]